MSSTKTGLHLEITERILGIKEKARLKQRTGILRKEEALKHPDLILEPEGIRNYHTDPRDKRNLRKDVTVVKENGR